MSSWGQGMKLWVRQAVCAGKDVLTVRSGPLPDWGILGAVDEADCPVACGCSGIGSWVCAGLVGLLGDRRPGGEGHTVNGLGEVYREQERLEEAITCYQQALAIPREEGDRHVEGTAMNNLGITKVESWRPRPEIARQPSGPIKGAQ